METGQAAGLAAAVCAKQGGLPVQQTPLEALLALVHQYGSCCEESSC